MDNDYRNEHCDIQRNGINSEEQGLQGSADGICEEEYIARRLTPTECARLQGFPDDWCSDVPHSDSAEYKLWGNGIALPSILGIVKNCFDHIEAMDF